MRLLPAALLALALTGCTGTVTGGSKEATVRVEAPDGVCWSGSIGNATQDGCGTQEFPVTDELGIFSSNVQKKDDSAEPVTISIVQDGEVKESNSTSAPFGVAQVALGA
jgi:hypothetical protein